MAVPTDLKDTRVKRFSPVGSSDSLDATDEFPGACSAITNLVPDLSTRNLWTCRPGYNLLFNFQTVFTPAGVISVFKVVGSIVFGMVGDLGGGGEDAAFAYNILTNALITITNAGGAVAPRAQSIASAAAFGTWQPPVMDVVGTRLIITHPGYATTGAMFGWIDISNPLAPVYHSGTTTGAIIIATVPTWVAQFNGRAWFGVNPAAAQPSVVFTDPLSLNVTNANQALTFGDNLFLTCAAPLGLSNQLGGIIQSLMVFKGANNIAQITGDAATSNLTINTLNIATGTLSPRSLVKTPLGLGFMSPAGLRIIDQSGTISDPIGGAGKGVVIPFISSVYQQLTVAGCNGDTLRICFYTGTTSVEGWAEYWYNIPRKCWSGPHTFFSFTIDSYNGTFISTPAPIFNLGQLVQSDVSPNSSSIFTEFGGNLTYKMGTAVLEDNGQMAGSELCEMQIVGSGSSNTMTVTVSDPNGTTINTTSIIMNSTGLFPHRVDFPSQTVFNRAAVSITGTSAAGVRIGDTWLRLRTLGYIPPPPNPPAS